MVASLEKWHKMGNLNLNLINQWPFFMDKSCKLISMAKLWPLMVPFHALQTKPWIECWLFFIGESILIFKQYPYATSSLDETVYKPNIRIFFSDFANCSWSAGLSSSWQYYHKKNDQKFTYFLPSVKWLKKSYNKTLHSNSLEISITPQMIYGRTSLC